jgi:hypothetical protein
MSKTMHSVPCSILCGLLMALGGCEHVAEPAARDRAPLAEPRMASARELAGLPVDSPGKPSGPIGVRHRDLAPAMTSVPLAIELEISASRPATALNGEVIVRDGLFLAPEQSRFTMDNIEPDRPAAHVLTVTPTAAGTHRVVVVVTARIDGQMQAATHSIDVQVGSAETRRALAGPVRIDEGGEAVIVLPAN